MRARQPHADDVLSDVDEQRVAAERDQGSGDGCRDTVAIHRQVRGEDQPDRDGSRDEHERGRPEPFVHLDRGLPQHPEHERHASERDELAEPASTQQITGQPSEEHRGHRARCRGQALRVVASGTVAVEVGRPERGIVDLARHGARRHVDAATPVDGRHREHPSVDGEQRRGGDRNRPPFAQSDHDHAGDEPREADALQHTGDPQRVEAATLAPPPEDDEADRDQRKRAQHQATHGRRRHGRTKPLRHPGTHEHQEEREHDVRNGEAVPRSVAPPAERLEWSREVLDQHHAGDREPAHHVERHEARAPSGRGLGSCVEREGGRHCAQRAASSREAWRWCRGRAARPAPGSDSGLRRSAADTDR